MTGRATEDGFSLVETLVALAIIAAMIGVYCQAIGTSASATRTLRQRRAAVMLAHALLAQTAIPSLDLAGAGTSGRLRWTVRRRPVAGGMRDGTLPLEDVRIDIADAGSGRRLASVRTLRLGR